MTSAKIDELDAMRAKVADPEWDAKCLSSAIRHINKNVDHDAYCLDPSSPDHKGMPGRGDGAYIAALHNAYPQLAALIRQQQAVIDRLPKSADGVPLAPGMLVWEADGSNLTEADGTPYEGFKVLTVGREYQCVRQRKQWVVLDGLGEVTTDRFYSTREAAQQATRSAAEQAAKCPGCEGTGLVSDNDGCQKCEGTGETKP